MGPTHIYFNAAVYTDSIEKIIFFVDETVEKNKKPASNEALDQYTLLDKHTKTSKIWSNQQILKFTNLIQEYPNGDCLSEFLTCLQASIQVRENQFPFLHFVRKKKLNEFRIFLVDSVDM